MRTSAAIAATLVAAAATAVVLATVNNGLIDAGDAVLLIVALALFARRIIRLASGTDERDYGSDRSPRHG
jgi:hypothetical protein